VLYYIKSGVETPELPFGQAPDSSAVLDRISPAWDAVPTG